MVEVKQAKSEAQKISERLKTSGADADVHTQTGSGPTRVHHHIHHFGAKNDGVGGAKPTAGTVTRHPETEVQGGAASAVGSGPQGRDVLSRGGR